MMIQGETVLIRDAKGALVEVGPAVMGDEFLAKLSAAAAPWERFAEAICRANQAYRQRPLPWLNRRKGRGSK